MLFNVYSYFSIPFKIPVRRVVEIALDERLHLTDPLTATTSINPVGKVGSIAAAKRNAHQVVETISLKARLQCILVDNKV